MFFATLTENSAKGHQALAAFTVLGYFLITAASLRAHGERDRYHSLSLRAVSLLREAARSSLRADRGGDATDVYADAARARIYVSAVDRLLTAQEVAKLTGVSLDELRNYVDLQLSNARTSLSKACGEVSSAEPYQQFQTSGGGGPVLAFKKPTKIMKRKN